MAQRREGFCGVDCGDGRRGVYHHGSLRFLEWVEWEGSGLFNINWGFVGFSEYSCHTLAS